MGNLLFAHNRIAYETVVKMFETEDRAAVIHPTGTGKSFIGFQLCMDQAKKKICWLSPSEYIFQTQMENFLSAGGTELPNVEFFTYAKLMTMKRGELKKIHPDYIVLDEFHRCGAEMWGEGVQRLLVMYKKAKILGLSATAIRYLDNQRNMADELFDGNVASEMTLGEAIVRGILNPPKYVLSIFSYQKDLKQYERRVKNAKNKAVRDSAEKYLEILRRALDKAEGLDVVFDKHMTDRTGKYIVFCADFEHMHEMIERAPEWFGKVDKETHIYTAYSNDPATSKAFESFKEDNSEHLKLLFCIDMLNEGVHVDDVSGVILFRPTVSPIIYKQQIGRALSASKSKDPIIFDIVNNIENLYSIGAIEQEMQVALGYYRSRGLEKEIVNEQFRIIDELRDCKALFERLNDTLTGSWDLMYQKAKAYYAEYGNLNVPKRYKTEEGYTLGLWIQTQRKVRSGYQYGNLDAKRIAKLDAIGMVWDNVRDIAWEKNYAAAKKFYQENGHLLVTARNGIYRGVALGAWISRLRMYRKSGVQTTYLTAERISALDEIGMVWDVPDYLWERNYQAAVAYYQKYQNLDVPTYYVTQDGVRLGNWLMNLRSARKTNGARGVELTKEQIQKLDELGFNWAGRYNSEWDKCYLAACEYKKANGNLDIPVAYVTKDGCRLGRWIRRQKEKFEVLSERRKKKLLDLEFDAKVAEPWEEKFALLKKYYQKHGNVNLPANYVVEGVWLGRWLSEQMARLNGKSKTGKTLTKAQIEKLASVGRYPNFSRSDIVWEAQYAEAKMFFEKNGHLQPPKDYTNTSGKNLGLWLQRQRAARKNGKLTELQTEKLDKIGMIWEFEDVWETGFQHALEYFNLRGDLLIPTEFVCADGYALGSWIVNQRVKFKSKDQYRKLTPEQIERLDCIGMVWDVDEFRWEEAYKHAEDFYQEKGHLVVSRYYGQEKGFDLYEWVMSQRNKYRSGELSENKVQKLEKIGMDWLTSIERDWENHYDSAERYYRKHGTLTMPCTYVDESGFPLGRWLWRIRTNKIKVRTEGANGNQVERLRAIGFEFSTETGNVTPKVVGVV
ncbi:MAG: helicase [Clostridiales bacterium]|nr:helicase [Clostridiales bacterium]MBE5747643.1 helicase [Clostridiales bacterium]